MLPRDSQDVERRQVSRLPSCFYIQLLSQVTDELSFAAFRRKHSGQKKQIARLDCFRIGAERLRWRRKLIPSSFNRCSALARRELSPVTICQRAHRRRRAAPPL